MPKRAYPFDNSFESQRKILVREKQINEGVMKEVNMEHIYDKTLKKLFCAGKHNQAPRDYLENNNNNNIVVNNNAEESRPAADMFTQLRITAQGTLTRDNLNSTQNLGKSPQQGRIPISCLTCKGNSGSLTCGFCDISMCNPCSTCCSKCFNIFCSKCSFSYYGDLNECGICLSCFKN